MSITIMAKYQTIKKFAAESGYTEAAIRTKIQDGTWRQGEVWIRAPDNKPLISVEGYHAWVEGAAAEQESGQPQNQALKLVSCSTVSSAANASLLSPAPLT